MIDSKFEVNIWWVFFPCESKENRNQVTDAKPRFTQTRSHALTFAACLAKCVYIFPRWCFISTWKRQLVVLFLFLARAPIFLHKITMSRFIFQVAVRVMRLSLTGTLVLCRDSLKFCTLAHEIISQRQIHMMFTSCFFFFLPRWRQISALIKSRGALSCVDKLLRVLCLDGLTLESVLTLCMVVSFLFSSTVLCCSYSARPLVLQIKLIMIYMYNIIIYSLIKPGKDLTEIPDL